MQSFVVLPLIATTLPLQSITKIEVPTIAVNTTINEMLDVTSPEQKVREERAAKINAYFRERNMPLEGTGMKMVLEAEKNGIDWRLLPAIAVRESTGGKHACKKVTNSFFGWGSCKINFSSKEEAIEIVARNLGGNNPRTAHYYEDKTVTEILNAYNPPSIVPKYHHQVVGIMETIENTVG